MNGPFKTKVTHSEPGSRADLPTTDSQTDIIEGETDKEVYDKLNTLTKGGYRQIDSVEWVKE